MTDNDTTPTEQYETDDSDPAIDPADGVETADDESLGLERRQYLQTVGVAGALGGLGLGAGAAGSAVAQESWEEAAEQRIEDHRMDDLEVVVEDENGNPVSDADVAVEMQEHDFTFGTAIHAEFLTRGEEWGEEITVDGWSPSDRDQERYREVVDEYFNTVVLENLHKWNLWEENQDIADEATQWALDRDKDVRGHVCVWGSLDGYAVPPRVVEAMGQEYVNEWNPDEYDLQADRDPEFVVEESMNHIEEIIDYYSDEIFEWEVVNEALPDHAPSIINAVTDGSQPHTASILGDWYEHAEEIADQYDIDIAVNDYNTLSGAYTNEWQQYEDQIDFLVNERGVDLDGIGMQAHHYSHERLSVDELWDAWERYSQYRAGLRITEFDMFGGGWDQQMQAEYMHRILKLFFSHPNAEQFLMWGFWDPLHWGDDAGRNRNAPLFERDWTEKEAFDVYTGLVFDEWWTDESGTTDSDGSFETRVFHGEHEVTVSADGETTTETVRVTDEDGATQLVVTVGSEGNNNGGDEIVVDGNEVQDTTGDGLYNDFDGDGDTTRDDVTTFFENLENDAIQNNPDGFDFDENGRIGFGDVVDLLRDV